jgi:hypothetical protein
MRLNEDMLLLTQNNAGKARFSLEDLMICEVAEPKMQHAGKASVVPLRMTLAAPQQSPILKQSISVPLDDGKYTAYPSWPLAVHSILVSTVRTSSEARRYPFIS